MIAAETLLTGTALSGGVLLAAAVLLWPRRISRWRAHRRRVSRGGSRNAEGIGGQATMPEALELLALAMSGGADVRGAIRTVSQALDGDLSEELAGVAMRIALGDDDAQAWGSAPQRWQPAANALQLASRAGVAPSTLLLHAAKDARRDALIGLEVATAKLAIRLVLPLGLAFLPAFVLTAVVPVVIALAQDVGISP